MKIETVLAPRKEGTVTCQMGATRYVFKRDEKGRLSADVDVQEHIRAMLLTGNFIPAEEGDFDVAAVIAGDGDEPDDEDPPGDGMPVESNTPPSPRRRRVKE